jgi:hypothetical protein
MMASGGAATTAIVHTVDGVCFVATASSPDVLFERLAVYVQRRCDDVLWADAASAVRALLEEGDVHAAVTRYFERTGERWDAERLELVTLSDGA